ncbi:hypothetical protein CDL15_Pgr028235 [Punica granatum]|uniref:Protein kinase domain-containing protein n=1 Tax=Punica granatum TaxID=22663 RepID=A0A218WUC8_PUNGR|nr:hypothetical protein CDL15_Pgr028235 [Punica granatum]
MGPRRRRRRRRSSRGLPVAGIVIGSVLSFLLIVALVILLWRRTRNEKTSRSMNIATIKQPKTELWAEKPTPEAENGGVSNGYSVAAAAAMTGSGKGGGAAEANANKLMFFGNSAKVFDLEDLLRASAEVLGKGTFGTAYKAVLEVGTAVAVKRLKDVNVLANEFKDKIGAVGAMDHESLVHLRAYYYSVDEKLLVYDYMPMGSLSALLHGNKGAGRTPLNWQIRSTVALGAARGGVEYIHSRGPWSPSHGNIKSSNILLTQSYEARVSDFGLAHLVGPSTTPNRVAGYRAPEVTDPRRVSQKADVYSFGVLLLELITC